MKNGMRALTVVTIVMGVLIVAGTGVLIAVIVHRASNPSAAPAAVAAGPVAAGPAVGSGAPLALRLDEPAGTRIAGIAGAGDRLAVELQGGGTDRVVLVDPRTGAVTGRITLAR